MQVQQDASATRVDSITWTKTITPGSAAMHPGVNCLRSTLVSLDDATLWHTYIMLTNLESVFRSLNSAPGPTAYVVRPPEGVKGLGNGPSSP